MINVIVHIIAELLLFFLFLFLIIRTTILENRLDKLEEKVKNLDW